MNSPSLNAARRARELAELQAGATVDVLVVGGGITGAGVALDAASRGLSVALVEQRDLAHGSSRWSSKLVHGGLRYIAQGHPVIAFESARERAFLLANTAPHLVRPFQMLLPFSAAISFVGALRYWLGGVIMNWMRIAAGSARALLPPGRRVGAEEALRLVPALKPEGLRGGLVYWDAQVEDDARLVLAVARTAAAHGARILTYVAAEELRGDGARLRDERTGVVFEVKARHVVNATGVWASTLAPAVALRPSKGTHLVLRSKTLGDPRAAFSAPVPGHPDQFVFAVPQPDGTTFVGLTDDPLDGPLPDVPMATPDEVAYLRAGLSASLHRPLEDCEIIGTFAGLRPLLAGGELATRDLSRRHVVLRGIDGVLTIVGGKLTTYRQMAQDVVDLLSAVRCTTRTLPLVGAAPPAALRSLDAPERLVRRYGAEAPAVAAMAGGDPSLLVPIDPALPVLPVELLFGLAHEGALTADDLLDRRTRVGLVPEDRARIAPMAERMVATAEAALGAR
jgi:glycerol-3-phosphate dehydrogenase